MRDALYHVTFTSNVPSIKRKGLLTFQTTNWIKAGDKSRYGSGEVYAFEHETDAWRWAAKMDWAHFQKTGSGRISVVQLKASPEHVWEVDHGDPLSQAASTGQWLKTRRCIAADHIVIAVPFSLKVAKRLVRTA